MSFSNGRICTQRYVKKQGLEKEFYIKSSATSCEEIGNDIHYSTRDKLIQNGISFTKRKAVKLRAEDYKNMTILLVWRNQML